MKKILIIALILPLFSFSQLKDKKNFKPMKKAFIEKQMIDNWKEYSKAFEYADYNKIASYFTFPLTFSIIDNPVIIENKKDLISFYKEMRTNVQNGYKYSLLDKSKIIWLSKDVYMIDAIYSRYDKDYKRIFQGRGIYMYKKINDKWKMFSVSGLSMPTNKNSKK